MTTLYFDAPALKARVKVALGDRAKQVTVSMDEVTVVVGASDYHDCAKLLRDGDGLHFDQLMDLCGVDYSDYRDGAYSGPRFCVVSHLLSVRLNQRLRLKVFAPEDEFPVVASVTDLWTAGNWFEREAFDLFGIVFDGHADLRRILTDYGFIGHPFRKDFPTSGHVEMRFDAEQRRVIYQPVTIEPREITPRVIREDNYGGIKNG